MNIQVLQLNINSENWARVYLEPDSRWSAGGGRITVNLGDDYLGSHFFSHVGNGTFTDFIANCGSDYLVNKLFQTETWIPVEDHDELFECIAREHMDKVRQARDSSISKEDLRDLYEDLYGRGFVSMFDLSNQLDQSSRDTMDAIFGEDWWYEDPFKKRNFKYDWHLKCIKAIQGNLKEKVAA